MVVALWSAAGGSGTSVLTAACALALVRDARSNGVRVVDLAGDLPAVFGAAADPEVGVADWLDVGVGAPLDALDRLAFEAAPGVALLPLGGAHLESSSAAPECGAALVAALSESPVPVLVDCGTAREPARRAVVESADVAVVVMRACYLALRRAVHAPSLAHTAGIAVLEESGRSLSSREVGEVLDLPVLVRVPVKDAIGRAVDAGVLGARMPEPLARAATALARRAGVHPGQRGAAA